MLKLLKMSFLNLFRYKSRSIITLAAIGISVFFAILVDAFLLGIQNQSNINLITYETAETVVYAEGYLEKKESYPSDLYIDAQTRAEIEKALNDNDILYSPRFKGLSELVFYDEEKGFEGTLNAELYGIDTVLDSKIFALQDAVEEGVWLSESDLDEAIVVGNTLAAKLGLEIGSHISVQGTGNGGFSEVIDACVVGIIKTEDVVVNSYFVFMKLPTLDEYFALDSSVSVFEVSDGKPGIASSRFRSRIQKILSGIEGIEIWDWEQDNPKLVAVMKGDQGSSYVILLFLFIIAAAGIANIMTMSIMERRKECAMLRAEGFTKASIIALFMVEGMILGVFGSIVGAITGALVNYPLTTKGVDLTPFIGEIDLEIGYRISLLIRTMWSAKTFIGIPLLAIAMTLIATFFSVLKAAHGEIAAMTTKI